MNLPLKGLIVSCYLESMRGCEKDFIASVVNNKHVVGLRVEGLDNIRYARMLTDKFIVGLVKKSEKGKIKITPAFNDFWDILSAGADKVATGCCLDWDIPFQGQPLMLDLDNETFETIKKHIDFNNPTINNSMILATTYEDKGYDLMLKIKEVFPEAKVNLEGGLMCREDIQKGFELGADWVTIGKAINDPPTVINYLMDGVL